MVRNYRSKKLVHLPRLNANGDVLLGDKMIAVARAERRLPSSLRDLLEGMEQAHKALFEAQQDRVESPRVIEVDRKGAHNAEVAAWSTLRARIEAWSRLPRPNAAARRIEEILFYDGLQFLRLSYEEAWEEAEYRLKVITKKELDGAIRELAGEAFYKSVLEVHARAAEVLGIKEPARKKKEAQIRKRRLAFGDAVRKYVAHVTIYADRDAPSEALADRLLAPLVRWKEARAQARAEDAPSEAAAPTIPDAQPE